MTGITDFASLQTAVTEYLARDQDATLIARIPTFIQLAEAKFNRVLFTRQMETRSTTSVDITTAEPEFISLPTDFQSMRRIRISSVTGKPTLQFLTGEQMEEYRYAVGNSAGQPLYFSVLGTELELAKTPDANYTLEMVYRANIPALTSTNTTNWLITAAPDAYLYGTLLEAAPYMKDDQRIATWAQGLSTVIDGINSIALTSTFNAGPMQVRASGVTP